MLNRHIQHQNNKKQQLNSLILKGSAVIYFFKTDKVGKKVPAKQNTRGGDMKTL